MLSCHIQVQCKSLLWSIGTYETLQFIRQQEPRCPCLIFQQPQLHKPQVTKGFRATIGHCSPCVYILQIAIKDATVRQGTLLLTADNVAVLGGQASDLAMDFCRCQVTYQPDWWLQPAGGRARSSPTEDVKALEPTCM